MSLITSQVGAATPADAEFIAPTTAARSGRAIAADAQATHAVDQDSATNPERVAERDAAVAADDHAKQAREMQAAVEALRALIRAGAARGFTVSLEVGTAPKLVVE